MIDCDWLSVLQAQRWNRATESNEADANVMLHAILIYIGTYFIQQEMKVYVGGKVGEHRMHICIRKLSKI